MSSNGAPRESKKSPLLEEPGELEEGRAPARTQACGSGSASASENGTACPVCKSPFCRCGPGCRCADMQQPEESDLEPDMRLLFAVDRLQSMDTTEKQLLVRVAKRAGAAQVNIMMVTGKLEVILPEQISRNFRCALTCAGFSATLSDAAHIKSSAPDKATSVTDSDSRTSKRPWIASPSLRQRGQSARNLDQVGLQTELESAPRALADGDVLLDEEKLKPICWTAVIKVGGMSCAACVGTVERCSRGVEGVVSASVSLLAHRAEVKFQHPATGTAIAEAIEDIGFDAELLQTLQSGANSEGQEQPSELRVALKTGADAAALKESALRTGAVDCVMFTGADRARLMYWPSKVGARDLLSLFSAQCEYAGDDVEEDPAIANLRNLQRRALLAFLPTLCIILLAEISTGVFWDVIVLPNVPLALVIVLLLTPFVTFYCGRYFHASAISAIRHYAFTMNTLVSLSTSVSFLYGLTMSILAMIFGDDGGFDAMMPAMFCEDSAVLVTVLLCGRILEAWSKVRTTAAIRDLQSQRPTTALLVQEGAEADKKIHYDLIQVGDTLRVLPGEAVPVDGEVVSEDVAFCDESLLTGEAHLVEKVKHSKLVGGSVCAQGSLLMRAEGVGNSSTIARILQLVEAAQARQPSVQRVVDTLASVFTPVILVVALVTFLVWVCVAAFHADPPTVHKGFVQGIAFAVTRCVSVLSIACPCSMGLATPTAMMVASGLAARYGCLVKDAAVWERTRRFKHAVLDKTGTITEGRPRVVSVALLPGLASMPEASEIPFEPPEYPGVPGRWLSEETTNAEEATAKVGWILAAAEAGSEHPLSRALLSWGASVNMGLAGEAKAFMNIPGKGVHCSLEPVGTVAVGSLNFVDVAEDGPAGEWAHRMQADRCIVVGVKVKEVPVALLALRDEVQEEAAEVVASLQRRGINVWMCTGDHAGTAHAVAELVGIDPANVRSQCLPDAKAELVKDLAENFEVLMVGDGLNDAAALASASVGIAIGAGSHVTVESAQVVLTRSRLSDVVAFLELGSATMWTVYRNFMWALAFNIIGIPLAAGVGVPWGVDLPPIACGAAMACSSVLVITSSLLLRCLYRGPHHRCF